MLRIFVIVIVRLLVHIGEVMYGISLPMISQRNIQMPVVNVGKILKKFFFLKLDISCRMNNGKSGTSYSGIYWKHDASEGDIINNTGVADTLPKM